MGRENECGAGMREMLPDHTPILSHTREVHVCEWFIHHDDGCPLRESACDGQACAFTETERVGPAAGFLGEIEILEQACGVIRRCSCEREMIENGMSSPEAVILRHPGDGALPAAGSANVSCARLDKADEQIEQRSFTRSG